MRCTRGSRGLWCGHLVEAMRRPLPRVEWKSPRPISRECAIARSRSRDERALQGAMDLSDQYRPTACAAGLSSVPPILSALRARDPEERWTRKLLALSRGFDSIDLARRPAA